MNLQFKVMLITCFMLGGLVTLVHASGTSSSSSSWGTVSSSQQSPDASQGSSSSDQPASDASQEKTDQPASDTSGGVLSSDQQNPNTSQGTSSGNQENLIVTVDAGLTDMQKKSEVSLYDQGVDANTKGDYKQAKTLFEQALSINSNNPDTLNMLAHVQLKVGMIDESLANYKKALQLRPRFPEAREYLGETYIQAALRELTTLKSYGRDGDEQAEDLEQEIKKAAGKL